MLLQSSKLLQSTPTPTHHRRVKPLALANPNRTRISCRLSRRELAVFTNSSLLLSTSQALLPGISKAGPEEEEEAAAAVEPYAPPRPQEPACIERPSISKRAFLDISIDRQPVGRIVVGIYEAAAPLGASRFMDLVSGTGRAGVSYRRKEFVKIMPSYVQHGGIRSYELANNDALEQEWDKARSGCPGRTRNSEGSVSIVVRNPSKPPPKTKLVARGGKLEIDEEQVGADPNGTEFLICSKDSPELDDSALVIGRVVEGMDVVHRIAQVKTVRDNTSSPYFRVAKLIGDKRAVVAERGFNRPYSKVLVANCGLLEE